MIVEVDQIPDCPQRWIPLPPPMKGGEVLIILATPKQQLKFRQKCIRQGVLRKDETTPTMGREDDYFRMISEQYVLNWKNITYKGDATYSSNVMGTILGKCPAVLAFLLDAINEDADFFASNGDE